MGTIVGLLIAIYILSLGFGFLVNRGLGVRYVNRLARRVVALPIHAIGLGLIRLAVLVRG